MSTRCARKESDTLQRSMVRLLVPSFRHAATVGFEGRESKLLESEGRHANATA